MLFWIVTAGLTVVVLGMLAATALLSVAFDRPPAAYDLDVYRDQLREVERDTERGVLSPDDAERVTAEISRRILSADAALARGTTAEMRASGPVVIAVLLLVAGGGAFGLYTVLGAPGYGDLSLQGRIAATDAFRATRPTQAAAEAGVSAGTQATPADPDYVVLVQQLRDALTDRPDDLNGYILLTQAEGRLGNFAAAHAAKAQVIDLKGPNATAQDFSEYADLLILAAGGYVSPEAEAALERTLAADPTDGPARYYYGQMLMQVGRPDQALPVWDQLLREGPPDAPWIAPIRSQIDEIAIRAGVNYAQPVIGTGRGPSADDIEAAGALSPAERMEMIQGMVSGLSERLATEGGPVEDWAQLISALGVLGRTQDAAAILANARAVFGDDPTAVDTLARVADRVGLE